jgi:hypothetical protein
MTTRDRPGTPMPGKELLIPARARHTVRNPGNPPRIVLFFDDVDRFVGKPLQDRVARLQS